MKFTNEQTENLSFGKGSNKKFKELATIRVKMISKYLKRLGKLSNKTNYKYTTKELDKIFEYLDSELNECKRQYKHSIKQEN
jgi:hypothetical protein